MKDIFGNEATILPEEGEEEIWVDVVGFPQYEVSTFGNIKNKKRKNKLTPRTDKNGYEIVWLYHGMDDDGEQRKCVKVHRVVCEAFYGTPAPDEICDHRDFCRSNNYYKNLRWVDRSESVKHRRPIKRDNVVTLKSTPVVLVDKNTHQMIQKFSSILEAHKQLGLNEIQIFSNIKGYRVPFSIGYFMTEEQYNLMEFKRTHS